MLAALIVFAISPILVLYAGTAKQYSGDIAVTLFLLSMTLWYRDEPTGYAHAAVVGIARGGHSCFLPLGVLVAFGLGRCSSLMGNKAESLPGSSLRSVPDGWWVQPSSLTYR